MIGCVSLLDDNPLSRWALFYLVSLSISAEINVSVPELASDKTLTFLQRSFTTSLQRVTPDGRLMLSKTLSTYASANNLLRRFWYVVYKYGVFKTCFMFQYFLLSLEQSSPYFSSIVSCTLCYNKLKSFSCQCFRQRSSIVAYAAVLNFASSKVSLLISSSLSCLSVTF